MFRQFIYSFIRILLVLWVLGFTVSVVNAIVDPLSVPNNRIGVHILEPSEIASAASLVNSSGGDWGYVTIPLRADDRDFDKWSEFFTSATRLHLIPIIRLATFAAGPTWVAPTVLDLVDFANFLAGMPWPVKNRYVILFNEPNHAAEWGGTVSPLQYVNLLIDAHLIFKSRSQDFFLLTSGLDMSAPTNHTSLDALQFYRALTLLQPRWYSFIDGLSVHAYPNPGFASSVNSTSRYGITSFRYETQLLRRLGFPPKPVFITETGRPGSADFFLPALTQIWTDPDVVAVTPFLLFAGAGEFTRFSLLDTSKNPTAAYNSLLNIPKISGSPLLSAVSALRRLSLSGVEINVEIADTQPVRTAGLSGRSKLDPATGMLFIFPDSSRHSFWMQGMNFALDFVWIKGGKIVQITPDVPPPSQTGNVPRQLTPDQPVDQVLEVPAGFTSLYETKVGDVVKIISP
ncbi:hypothetical protein A3H89_04135 [Candidatus Amesbacteria bacterium RIFCSPLOWO2_02_FULL_48_11]|nr:MAG: hypothetical protein A3H89_04135 [Candidatus Amesbacteria bacterium RIFCSPLOWO2_02_FULL_48_11]